MDEPSTSTCTKISNLTDGDEHQSDQTNSALSTDKTDLKSKVIDEIIPRKDVLPENEALPTAGLDAGETMPHNSKTSHKRKGVPKGLRRKAVASASGKPVFPLEIVKSSSWVPDSDMIEISLNGDASDKVNSVVHFVIDEPATDTHEESDDSAQTVSVSEDQLDVINAVREGETLSDSGEISREIESELGAREVEVREVPPNCPIWATRLKDCEEIGNSYRGYVETETELELLLTYHRQQTGTTWGTRQSPTPARESKRLMWKSNYVPYDGIPFLNIGSRAAVMECQYGPRRKGGPNKRSDKSRKPAKGSCTCPARIYLKKVKKFPDFKVDISPEADKIMVKKTMDHVFQMMKEVGVDTIAGVERYYVQLPTNQAHQYHTTPEYQISPDSVMMGSESKSRLHPELCEKIRELVANGEINAYLIRQSLRNHVVCRMFAGENAPERHNLYYFPTINDIKNHVLLAISAIEKGELEAVVPITISDARAITDPPPASIAYTQRQTFGQPLWDSPDEPESNRLKPASSMHQMWPTGSDTSQTQSVTVTLTQGSEDDQDGVMKQDSPKRQLWSADSSRPQPRSVTVTFTPNPEEGGSIISQVETHLSDGTMVISDSLTPETARLISQINQHCQEVQEAAPSESEELDQSQSLLEDPKSMTPGLGQSDEGIIDSEKNDPTLSQSRAMIGLTDTSSDDGNNQSESLLDTADTNLSESEGLLHDTASVTSMDQSKHLLDSDPSVMDQSGSLLHESEELTPSEVDLGTSEALEARDLLLRATSDLNDMQEDSPLVKRPRYEV